MPTDHLRLRRPIPRFRRRAAGAILLAATLASCRRVAPAAAASGAPAAEARRAEPPRAAARPASNGYAFTLAEAAAVDEFVRHNPTLRLAADGDRRRAAGADAELRGLYGVYHPYFVRGDMNDDGVLDFVLGFVRRDNAPTAPWFSIVVFTGKPGAGAAAFSGGTFLERDVTLARGDVSVDRDSIVITPDLDEESVRRYKWDPAGRAFVFVPDDGEEADPPSLTQTSLSLAAGPYYRLTPCRAKLAARLWPRPLRTLHGPAIPFEALSSPPSAGERAG